MAKEEAQEYDIPGQNTQWNMAMFYYNRLNQLIGIKDNAACMGDLMSWYSGLLAIYRNIYFKVRKDKELEEELEKGFKEVRSALLSLERIPNPQYKQLESLNINDKLHELDKKIWYILDKNRMVMPKFKALPGLTRFERKNKLGGEE